MKIRLSKTKLKKIKKLIVFVLNFQHLRKQKFEKLIDFLTFCVKIIIFDRFFFISFYKIFERLNYYYNIINALRQNFL